MEGREERWNVDHTQRAQDALAFPFGPCGVDLAEFEFHPDK